MSPITLGGWLPGTPAAKTGTVCFLLSCTVITGHTHTHTDYCPILFSLAGFLNAYPCASGCQDVSLWLSWENLLSGNKPEDTNRQEWAHPWFGCSVRVGTFTIDPGFSHARVRGTFASVSFFISIVALISFTVFLFLLSSDSSIPFSPSPVLQYLCMLIHA